MSRRGDDLDLRLQRARKVRAARLAKRWTQWDLADELNDAAGTPWRWRPGRISDIERTVRQIWPEEVELFERVLGVDL